MLFGLIVTALFASGHLWWGVVSLCAIGCWMAWTGSWHGPRLRQLRQGGSTSSFWYRVIWWTALAYRFQTDNLRSAYWLLLLLVGSTG